MTNSEKVIDYENVNGVALSLKVNRRNSSPSSRHFTISYKSKEKKSNWPKVSLFLAVVFNVIALCYVRISLTAVVSIVVGFSFLALFWVTHSVQSVHSLGRVQLTLGGFMICCFTLPYQVSSLESLLVIPTVGIQSSVKYVYGREDNFIPWSRIDDVIINEVIKMNRVLYFLTVLVKTDSESNQEADSIKLIPLFKYTKPRLLMLEKIYSELQGLLSEARKGESYKGSGDIG